VEELFSIVAVADQIAGCIASMATPCVDSKNPSEQILGVFFGILIVKIEI